MRKIQFFILCALIARTHIVSAFAQGPISTGRKENDQQTRIRQLTASIPLTFEENKGQAHSQVEFSARANGYSLLLSHGEAMLALPARDPKEDSDPSKPAPPSQFLHMRLVGGKPSPKAIGVDKIAGVSNYFIGNDHAKWRTNVANYAKVKYEGVYPGIDLVYYGNNGGLEYDLVVAPGADPNCIEIEIDDADSSALRIDGRGDLVAATGNGDVHFHKPTVYQPGLEQDAIEGKYVLKGRNRVAFAIGEYDRTKPIIIDPAIAYSTFMGGSSGILALTLSTGVAVFEEPISGRTYAYVTGYTTSIDWGPGAMQFGSGAPLAGYPSFATFVLKIDPKLTGSQSLVWATYLAGTPGPSSQTVAQGIAVDQTGNAFVAGATGAGFPTVNAYQTALRGPTDAFLAKISAGGSALLYSSYLGGSGDESGKAVALDSAGRAYLAGETTSADLPIINAFQPGLRGTRGNLIAILDTTLSGAASLVYSTYFGGTNVRYPFGQCEHAIGLRVDRAGAVHISGFTSSPDLPILNGFQPALLPGSLGAGFYAKLNPFASWGQLLYSTYLGSGELLCSGQYGVVPSLAVDDAGKAYLAGLGVGVAATPGALAGGGDFVMKIDPSQAGPQSLVFSASLPARGEFDSSRQAAIAVDASGNSFVVGKASRGGLPNPLRGFTSGVMQSVDAGDTFTLLGTGISDPTNAIAIDASTTPRTLYAATDGGVFKSLTGGLQWSPSNSGLEGRAIQAVAIDPANTAIVYAGTDGGVFKSTDGGTAWTAFNSGFGLLDTSRVSALAFVGPTLYAGASDGLYKLSSSGIWGFTGLVGDVRQIVADSTTTPPTIYAADSGGDVERSSDGGIHWTSIRPDYSLKSIAIDPATTPKTLYACADYGGHVTKSVDGGITWSDPNFSYDNFPFCWGYGNNTIFVDTSTSPSTIYVLGGGPMLYRTRNGFASWDQLRTAPWDSAVLVVDGSTSGTSGPATIYSASGIRNLENAYLAEIDSTGSKVLFSTYLGAYDGSTGGLALALDSANNIYAVGGTGSPKFPSVNGFQPSGPDRITAGVGFFTKIGVQALPVTSTPSETQVITQTGTLSINFPNILGSTNGTSPTLNVTPVSTEAAANFSLSNNLGAYEIATTATYIASPSNPITLCFQVMTVNDQVVFNNLAVLHVVNGTPVDVTSSRNFTTRTLCGSATSLSPFVVVKGATDQLTDLIRKIDSFDLQHGIQTSLDAKIQNAIAALASAKKRDATTACNSMNAFIRAVNSSNGLTLAQSDAFTAAANQVRATLGCPK